ncbi:hypothetical protein [Chryseobacterium sp. Leaf394]|uniref:hypothetical protein n=1 Tax=Chryseobacterium sp. Leaf394 TaxID=1736361 RepID=UPI0006F4E187|nr:hypothetical protein [Chryseobacterium sp. Leaf394]KQS89916.1 hypothetical protein ASG21_13130 [Chryseobacterium sp. Leaf394]
MAIFKKASNINIQVSNHYTSLCKFSSEESESVIIEATKENLELSSQKRAVLQGFGKGGKEDVADKRVLIDRGVVNKGYWINEGGKKIIVNSKGDRGYDWIFGDAPSEAVMKANGMSKYDIFNINLTKSYTEAYLKTEMKSTLVGFSDIEDGFGKNGRALANHFFTGQGQPFTFAAGSNPSNEVKDSARFKSTFILGLKTELERRYNEKKYINESPAKIYQFTTKLPYYSAEEGLNPWVNEIAAFVGGIQGCIASYKLYQYEISKKGEVEIDRISFLDTFGAGWEDGGAGGMVKQWIPGLVAMFCLQHFKNTTDKAKYQPFTVIIDIEL